VTAVGCPAGHELLDGRRRFCPRCRRDDVIEGVAVMEPTLSRAQIAAAVDAAASNYAALRSLAAALAADADALSHGAPPVVGRLVTELIERGSISLRLPTCAVCGRTGRPLSATESGAMCQRCAARRHPQPCVRCSIVKPVAGRIADGQPICERCRRRERGRRGCGMCGKTTSIAMRAHDGQPDICVNCYRMPDAVCSVCGRLRECNFAASDTPICLSCSPRATARCVHCGVDRPPVVRWEEGPVCDRCYTAALRHRGRCALCGMQRRLVCPPGPDATTCADCADLPIIHSCGDCGIEDKLYEKGRCARCSLRRRTAMLLSDGTGNIAAELAAVSEAISATRVPRSALNWLRNGAGAGLLAELAAGRLAATHDALDQHPRRRAADYLRHILIAGGALAPRDEELARTEGWLTELLSGIDNAEHRRLVQAFATWRVMRRLRRTAEATPTARTYTAHARVRIKTAIAFLDWLATRGATLADCRHADVDDWLGTGPGAYHVRDFLAWAADRGHCHRFHVPGMENTNGAATDPEQRWTHLARLLHDDDLDVTDRVAGCLLLLFGQQQSRIAAMTTDQVTVHGADVHVRFGQHELPVPEPLGVLLQTLIRDGRPHVGVGSPAHTRWLFPGGLPGRPITASRLAERLRALGIRTQTGRRAALIDLAAQLPAAVLADLLNLSANTAVRWMRQAGGDWNNYAAELARARQSPTMPNTEPQATAG